MTVHVRPMRDAEVTSLASPDDRSGLGPLATDRGTLPLRQVDVTAHITGLTARTQLTQVFANPYDVPLEATYIFPLPDRAAVSAMRMEVADRVIDAGPAPMPGHALAGINLLDTATHTWDLATATGQPAELPDLVATAALEASRVLVTPEIRRGRFGAEQPTPAHASTTDRLVAFLGRQP